MVATAAAWGLRLNFAVPVPGEFPIDAYRLERSHAPFRFEDGDENLAIYQRRHEASVLFQSEARGAASSRLLALATVYDASPRDGTAWLALCTSGSPRAGLAAGLAAIALSVERHRVRQLRAEILPGAASRLRRLVSSFGDIEGSIPIHDSKPPGEPRCSKIVLLRTGELTQLIDELAARQGARR